MQKQSIRSIKEKITKELSGLYGEHEARSIAFWVMEAALEKDRAFILSNLKEIISGNNYRIISGYLEQLKQGKPIQYVCGYAFFRDLKLIVDKSVLIPRPETELLVEEVLKYYNMPGKPAHGLDIGTGSGCIPVSLMTEARNISMDAMDKSQSAINIAGQNGRQNKAGTNFVVDDIFAPDLNKYPECYDFIVSNPPYVLETDKTMMHKNVLEYEPGSALFVEDDNALVYYRAIVKFSKLKLKPGGRLFLEIHEKKAAEIHQLLQANAFTDIRLIKDFHGKDRIVIAQLNQQ